jgi:hypothetical protein
VELVGTIETDAAVATRKTEWIHVIETHPQLSAVEAKKGVNPFSKRPQLCQSSQTTAQVIIDRSQCGFIHWAMDDSRRLVVWSIAGAEEKVRGVAIGVAARLGWHFRVP